MLSDLNQSASTKLQYQALYCKSGNQLLKLHITAQQIESAVGFSPVRDRPEALSESAPK